MYSPTRLILRTARPYGLEDIVWSLVPKEYLVVLSDDSSECFKVSLEVIAEPKEQLAS